MPTAPRRSAAPDPARLPPALRRVIGSAPLRRDRIGESPCPVYRFERGGARFFLKISPPAYADTTYSVRGEAKVLEWLRGRLPVPELLAVAERERCQFMITRAVPGVALSACRRNREARAALLREALRQLQNLSIEHCPFDVGVPVRLRELDYLLAHDLIDHEYDLGAWPGLDTPQALLAHLHADRPEQQSAFSHGDLNDSNVFVDHHDRLWFIDLGRGGIGDRWLDIAFVHRNLREDLGDAAAAAFLSTLGEPDQPQRRRYFEQLDELF